MSDEELFRTGRLTTMRHLTPNYMPGASVFLQRDTQGIAKGSAARIISVQSSRPGEYRYQLAIGEQKIWAHETDIRPTPPGSSSATGVQSKLGPTQRLSTMTLTQRMTALSPGSTQRIPNLDPGSTQRMHPLNEEERLKKLVMTNRLRTLGAAAQPAADSTTSTSGSDAAAPTARPPAPDVPKA